MGFSSEEDLPAFQASTEALALAASDALALTSLSLANATLFVCQRALGQVKLLTRVKDAALRLEIMPDVWFGPAAVSALEEERKDPATQARAIGGAISGAFSRALRHLASQWHSFCDSFRPRGNRRTSA